MKKLFIVLCDIMALAVVVVVAALVVWAISALGGWPAAGPAKTVAVVAAIVAVVSCAASYAAWRNGGRLDDQDDSTDH